MEAAVYMLLILVFSNLREYVCNAYGMVDVRAALGVLSLLALVFQRGKVGRC